MAPQNLRAAGDRIEQLLDELRAGADQRAYGQAEELLRLVTELYGAGLARILEIVRVESPAVVEAIVEDALVGSLLLVHEIHPKTLAQRVDAALSTVRPLLGNHGGDVELVDVDPTASAVRIRLLGSCDGCPSSSVTLQSAVERAILEAAPEVLTIDVDQPAVTADVPVQIRSHPSYTDCPTEMVVR